MELAKESDFTFAYNNAKFSDGLLRIKITGDDGQVGCSSIVEWVKDPNPRKRKRQDLNNVSDLELNKNDKKDEEAMEMGAEESESGIDGLVLGLTELRISSAVLAAKSPFFLEQFSNESGQRHVTLTIHSSEKDAVMELVNFMYTNSLSVTTAPAVLDVLKAAHKYTVASCVKYCTQLLLSMPMTVEYALLLLGLPSGWVPADLVKPLTNAARLFLASHYKEVSKIPRNEVVGLPLVAIEAILASDDLEIESEDILFDTVLEWAKTQYPDLDDRQEILGSRLARLIRFPHMTSGKLKEIMSSDDFKPAVASHLVIEALLFKAESKYGQRKLAAEAERPDSFVERAYKCKPVQSVEFRNVHPQCVAYLDLTRKECGGLYPSGRISSQVFPLQGVGFFLRASCTMDQSNSFHFAFGLGTQENHTVDYTFSARSKQGEGFGRLFKSFNHSGEGITMGSRNLFAMTWERFMSKDCPFFINDVLHLKAEFSIRH